MITSRFTTDTGTRISLFGYGAMRFPTTDGGHANGFVPGASDKEIDQAHVNRQVRRMLEAGVNYFDTSPVYCRGKSEATLGEALAKSGFPRNDYVIATKLSNFVPTDYPLSACKKMFERSLERLRTDYIDNYLLHSIGSPSFDVFKMRYVDNGAVDWCAELRASRRIRQLGFSFHGDRRAWDWCLEHHDRYHWDFAQIQMNYIDWLHAAAGNPRNINAKELYDELTALGIPVVIMEPLLGGTLARYNPALVQELAPLDPEASLAQWAFRFCGSFENVMTVLSGVTYDEHLEEDIRIFSPLKPLNSAEFVALECAARAYLGCNNVSCTACNYCMPCPYGLDIPSLFAFRNRVLAAKGPRDPRAMLKAYEKFVPEPLRRADHCTGCGRCRPHCPQQIDIPKEIALIDAAVDVLKTEVKL